ncbi:MAG: ATP synthase F1 subunit gamma [Lachnospiraceae bacterium]|nr:ATP synthase F1 subunit gamma [Lachnospiraceae bacterium]
MASMRDIKRRKSSVQSTQQITKAMKLVSTVKLQRAKANAERSKAYFEKMYKTVQRILARTGDINHKYLQESETSKKAVVVITSNRGLAGGYNSNIIKLVSRHEEWKKEDIIVYAIGSKGRDALAKAGYEVREDLADIIEEPAYADAMQLTNRLLAAFEEGEFGEIHLAYTAFKNTVSHIPTLLKLLPVVPEESQAQEDEEDSIPMNFEPDEEGALDLLIPKYIASLIYGGMVEAVASENGARMQAMDSATSNAEEMINDLTLKYNRARQSSITQELTEIIAGADAIS